MISPGSQHCLKSVTKNIKVNGLVQDRTTACMVSRVQSGRLVLQVICPMPPKYNELFLENEGSVVCLFLIQRCCYNNNGNKKKKNQRRRG